MWWKTCVSLIMKNVDRKFKDESGSYLSYDECTLDVKKRVADELKTSLFLKVQLIFGKKKDKDKSKIFSKITDVEVEFYTYLYSKLERNMEKQVYPYGNFDIYKHLNIDEWNYLSQDVRDNIIIFIDKLHKEQVISKYFPLWEKDIDIAVEKLKIKLSHTEYYVLMKNILQLCDILCLDYNELQCLVTKEELNDFSDKFDKLLKKHQKEYNSSIRSYSRTEKDIEDEIKANCSIKMTNKEYKSLVLNALECRNEENEEE